MTQEAIEIFQFQSGSIIREQIGKNVSRVKAFQFQSGSIIRLILDYLIEQVDYFNSNLVQL